MTEPPTFEFVNEGPVERTMVPGFGGAHVVRVVDDGAPDEWVDVVVGEDGRRELLRWSDTFSDESEAVQWLTMQ